MSVVAARYTIRSTGARAAVLRMVVEGVLTVVNELLVVLDRLGRERTSASAGFIIHTYIVLQS